MTVEASGAVRAKAPAASAAELKASDAMGALYVAIATGSLAAGLALSAAARIELWLLGQALIAVSMLQWFILLHEAGHLTLFRTRALNLALGYAAGFVALVPFASWRRIHALHHRWTGWQDRDPTTQALVPRRRSQLAIRMVDLAWRTWLPLFSLLYRLGNYWHLPRLWRMFRAAAQRRALVVNAVVQLAAYAALGLSLGAAASVQLFALALLLGFALQDPLILSQHTHLPQRLSEGRAVLPLSAEQQAPHTRSLLFAPWIARWLLMHFNAHELHHRFASVPGYRLGRLQAQQAGVHWWRWLRAAKRLRGSVFLFGNRNETGFPL
jgi:omega-6 fatty acid desaturase (delta-12 desaturase)